MLDEKVGIHRRRSLFKFKTNFRQGERSRLRKKRNSFISNLEKEILSPEQLVKRKSKPNFGSLQFKTTNLLSPDRIRKINTNFIGQDSIHSNYSR